MGWTVWGSNPSGSRFSARPDRPWGPPSLLYNGYEIFPGVKDGRGVLLTTHPLLVTWSWKGRTIALPTLWATTGSVMGTLYFIYWVNTHTLHFNSHVFRKQEGEQNIMKLQWAFLQIHFLSISSSSNLHCLFPFQYNSSSKPFYCIRHMMVLIYLIYVIMKEYTLSCREIFYIVNRHGIQFAVLYRPNS